MQIKFTVNELGKPPEYGPVTSVQVKKVADCELVFEDGDGPLAGHKLQGFVIWCRLIATETKKIGDISVSGPNFRCKVPERGHITVGLLRRIDDDTFNYGTMQDSLRSMIVDAYKQWAKPRRSRARKLLDKVVAL